MQGQAQSGPASWIDLLWDATSRHRAMRMHRKASSTVLLDLLSALAAADNSPSPRRPARRYRPPASGRATRPRSHADRGLFSCLSMVLASCYGGSMKQRFSLAHSLPGSSSAFACGAMRLIISQRPTRTGDGPACLGPPPVDTLRRIRTHL